VRRNSGHAVVSHLFSVVTGVELPDPPVPPESSSTSADRPIPNANKRVQDDKRRI